MSLLNINRKSYMRSPTLVWLHLTLVTLSSQCQGHWDFENIYLSWAELIHMLLLNINRNPYMGSPLTPSHLTLSDLERSKSRSLRFRSLISCKVTKLVHMLLLNIERKAYMGSSLMRLHLTSVTLKGWCQGHSDFESLYLVKKLS